MILYNVTIKIEHAFASEWVKWMKEEHMPELLSTGLFTDARLFRLLEVDEDDGQTYAAQYFCDDIEDYNKYIAEYAPAMRAKGFDRFKDKFVAFRSVMKLT